MAHLGVSFSNTCAFLLFSLVSLCCDSSAALLTFETCNLWQAGHFLGQISRAQGCGVFAYLFFSCSLHCSPRSLCPLDRSHKRYRTLCAGPILSHSPIIPQTVLGPVVTPDTSLCKIHTEICVLDIRLLWWFHSSLFIFLNSLENVLIPFLSRFPFSDCINILYSFNKALWPVGLEDTFGDC